MKTFRQPTVDSPLGLGMSQQPLGQKINAASGAAGSVGASRCLGARDPARAALYILRARVARHPCLDGAQCAACANISYSAVCPPDGVFCGAVWLVQRLFGKAYVMIPGIAVILQVAGVRNPGSDPRGARTCLTRHLRLKGCCAFRSSVPYLRSCVVRARACIQFSILGYPVLSAPDAGVVVLTALNFGGWEGGSGTCAISR